MNHILFEKKGNVAIALIDRPKALNALNSEVLNDLNTLADTVNADEEIRVLILTGSGEGANALDPYDGVMAYNALMMIKDFGSGNEFTVDNSFMTIADMPSEAMRGLIENPVNPFTGNPVSEDAKYSEDEQYVMLTDWRIAENHGNRFSDPVRLVLKNKYLFDESNWEVP